MVPVWNFPVAPRCADAKTTTNEGGNISNPARNLFFGNVGTFSHLQRRSKRTKSAVDRHGCGSVPTQNRRKLDMVRPRAASQTFFVPLGFTFPSSRRCAPPTP